MEIERVKLLKSIGRVLPAVAKKETFEQATKLVFKDGHLCAYNDEISIFDRLDETAGLDGAVDGKHLYSLLGKLAADQVTLEQDNQKLYLRAGRVKASFDLAPVMLPLGEIDRSGEDSEPLGEDFTKGLKLIAGTCARDMSKPVLTCISMVGELIEATDGFRAARLSLEGAELPKFLLPVTAAEVIVGYPVERVAVSDSDEWVRFSANEGATVIYARAFEGKFPDLAHLYELEGIDIALPEAMGKVLERAQIFSEREHAIDEVVQIGIRPNQITVAAAYDGGQFSEVVRSDQKVSADFSIHPDFLAEVLKVGTTCTVGEKRVKFAGPSWQHVIALR